MSEAPRFCGCSWFIVKRLKVIRLAFRNVFRCFGHEHPVASVSYSIPIKLNVGDGSHHYSNWTPRIWAGRHVVSHYYYYYYYATQTRWRLSEKLSFAHIPWPFVAAGSIRCRWWLVRACVREFPPYRTVVLEKYILCKDYVCFVCFVRAIRCIASTQFPPTLSAPVVFILANRTLVSYMQLILVASEGSKR